MLPRGLCGKLFGSGGVRICLLLPPPHTHTPLTRKLVSQGEEAGEWPQIKASWLELFAATICRIRMIASLRKRQTPSVYTESMQFREPSDNRAVFGRREMWNQIRCPQIHLACTSLTKVIISSVCLFFHLHSVQVSLCPVSACG